MIFLGGLEGPDLFPDIARKVARLEATPILAYNPKHIEIHSNIPADVARISSHFGSGTLVGSWIWQISEIPEIPFSN